MPLFLDGENRHGKITFFRVDYFRFIQSLVLLVWFEISSGNATACGVRIFRDNCLRMPASKRR
jgi:hypothetical protein